ncbi:response regulator receiver domain-containing protein [Neolewinella xylanilytica]|uniref:Response regulator receiver domain-containing protein n=1 Tax=Neolewinella xylanilytica TaxID=1514080 RepID=A0A2S6IBN9_9BACT|nr:response regulator [Neolewinella xylanilytica]PPK88923.1 response regulator receiver domain-containing protein [Neolewinella xylanilytica]
MSAPHILLIEDDPMEADLAIRTLKKFLPELLVTHLENGVALSDYLANEPDEHIRLAIMDLHMPGMGGLDFLESIRVRTSPLGFPVVIFSSSEDRDEITRAYVLGASGFVTKPVVFSDYRTAIEHMLNFWLLTNRLT